MAVSRGGLSIVFDERPALIRDKQGAVIGVDAMVRVFRAGNELRVDPHRICINPPVLVPDGNTFREDPAEAYLTWLVESLRDAPNARGWRTKGTVTTVYSDAADGRLRSTNATYATAAAGGAAAATTTNTSRSLGQITGYTIDLLYFSFDTSSITDTDTISAAEFALYGSTDSSATDDDLQARLYNWGAALSAADWRTPTNFSADTLLATFNTSGFSTAGYNAFTESGTNLRSNIDKAGTTYIVVGTARFASATAPTTDDQVQVYMADQAGTTNDPKLTVTHSADISAAGAAATVTVGGLAGAATVNTLASGALATVSVAGYAGTETHGATAAGGLATVSVAGLSGTGTYVVSGSGGLATVTVDGYGGEAGKITADGAVATVDVAGYAGTVTYDVSGAGGLATVDVAGYAGTVAYDVSGASGLATVTVAGLDGTGTYVVSGTGALGTVDVAGYAGETTVAVGGAGDVALVTVAGYAGAASYGVSSEGALAMVTVVGYAGRQLNRFVSGRRPRPGSGRFFGSGPGAGRFSPGRG